MSFVSDLSTLLDKYKTVDPSLDSFDPLQTCSDVKIAKECITFLNRIIKKRPKRSTEDRKKRLEVQKQKRMLTAMEKKKLHEKKVVNQMQEELLDDEELSDPQDPQTQQGSPDEEYTLPIRRVCYACKAYSEEGFCHHFYNSMCEPCGDFNYEMRTKTRDLTGYTAIVTGGRIKIGYEIALWLLRNNCTVIITTRFPADALLRLQKEADFETWKDRMFLYGLDFRDLKKVYQFIDYVYGNFKEINILINNAAQTLFQTDDYNKQLLMDEEKALKAIQSDPTTFPKCESALIKFGQTYEENQICTLEKSYPIYDVNHIPVDFSTKNSWTKTIEEVDFREFAEAQIINSWVPFIFCSQFKKIMKIEGKKSFIINVSAMEGKFDYGGKKSTHPHTNMAKAAMNMITRTSGREFAKDGIYMTSVDTGWCSEMHPQFKYTSRRTVPLDEIDGAMRVLHPIFADLNYHSVLLKDYKVTTW